VRERKGACLEGVGVNALCQLLEIALQPSDCHTRNPSTKFSWGYDFPLVSPSIFKNSECPVLDFGKRNAIKPFCRVSVTFRFCGSRRALFFAAVVQRPHSFFGQRLLIRICFLSLPCRRMRALPCSTSQRTAPPRFWSPTWTVSSTSCYCCCK
jgi:hypothetical protein